jgi:hypothetical protein
MEDLLFNVLTSGDHVLFWVLVAVGGLVARLILGQIKAGKVREIVERALDEIGDAVLEVAKTYVESLKLAAADGKLTDAEKADAKLQALQTAKRNIGPDGLKRLARVLGFDGALLDQWLGTKIEAAVASLDTRAGVSLTLPPPVVSTVQVTPMVTTDPH